MKTNRVETQIIRKSHPMWKVVDENCFYSKNLYNYANYIIRQEFVDNEKWLRSQDLQKILKSSDPYKQLKSQPSQCVLQILERSWKSYFSAIKDWQINKYAYLGMPKLPGYKKKDGRFVWIIKNNCAYIKEDGEIHFYVSRLKGFRWTTRAKGRLICVRFVPVGVNYKMEVVTEIEVPDEPTYDSKRVCSIDLGINNFVTMTNNIGQQPIIINGKGLKSYNQFYNKQRARILADLKKRNSRSWSKNLAAITFKRQNVVKNFMHNASRFVLDFCVENNIDTLVCGRNKKWKVKSHLKNGNGQSFAFVPYEIFLDQLKYKCQDVGIKFIETEESYTSGTSFLDGEIPCKENYDKTRRVKRGLFQSGEGLINADVNGSLQIMRKVFSNTISYEIEGNLSPVVINVVQFAT